MAPASYDPDEIAAPQFDDRMPLVIRVPDPVRSKRGFNARKRGVKTELELARLLEKEGYYIIRQGGPNRRDFVAVKDGRSYSVEVKHITGRWPMPGQVASAWIQVTRQSDIHTPLLVFSLRKRGVKTLWRVYVPDGYEDLADWIARERF